MKKICIAILGIAALIALPLLAEEVKLGKPIAVKSATPIKDILSQPDIYISAKMSSSRARSPRSVRTWDVGST